jgi:hypothetical protein
MQRWQHAIWVGAAAILLGVWTTPALAQYRQAGAKNSNQQGSGMCQQGNTNGQGGGVNAATSTRASGTQTPFNQANGSQNPYQQMNQAQMAMMMQFYMAQLNALQQQMGQTGNSQYASGQNALGQQRSTQNANTAGARRTAGR